MINTDGAIDPQVSKRVTVRDAPSIQLQQAEDPNPCSGSSRVRGPGQPLRRVRPEPRGDRRDRRDQLHHADLPVVAGASGERGGARSAAPLAFSEIQPL
jgi:hypothetical protein